MQIIPFRLFLSWSIVIIFLKPILRIFEFYRILYPMYKFQIFQPSQITFFIRLRNNPLVSKSIFLFEATTSSITSKAKQRLRNPLFQIKSDLLSKSRLTSLIRDHRGTEWRPFFDHEISAPTNP